jgi:hypothetical protein
MRKTFFKLGLGAVLLAGFFLASIHRTAPVAPAFSYNRRPPGYAWKAGRDPNTRETVYYGIDPSNAYTVYVGPDGVYYEFNHPPPVTPDDVRSRWTPPG